jgi:GLPGLI family protein
MHVMKFLGLILIFFLGLTCGPAKGQNPVFLTEGKIEFERKVNLYAEMKDWDDSWSELRKKTTPNFKTTYFDLYFKGNKTLYRPGRDNPDNVKLYEEPCESNVVYTDIENEKATSQKKVFEQSFLVQDSARRIKWKITDEIRTIAGFTCRRANAMIMDSIYVVAFYTEDILTPGGPESFLGLPGMILGVALPHQHITWFATKVELVKINQAQLSAPEKGKKITYSALKTTLNESLKDWGKYGRRYIQAAML